MAKKLIPDQDETTANKILRSDGTDANWQDDNVGNRTYTEQNYVTDGESVTDSIDALDIAMLGLDKLGDIEIIDAGISKGIVTHTLEPGEICLFIAGRDGGLYIVSGFETSAFSNAVLALPAGRVVSVNGMTFTVDFTNRMMPYVLLRIKKAEEL